MPPTLRRAHQYSSAAALVLPAIVVGLVIADRLFQLGLGSVLVVVGTFAGAVTGYCLAIGGGFTSNVRQPLMPSIASCAIAGAGAALSTTWAWPYVKGFANEELWAGVFLLGACPGIAFYVLLARFFGMRRVDKAVWTTLPW